MFLLVRLTSEPLRALRFIADAHLGGLARLLRLAGFDTLYGNHFDDLQIAEIAARELCQRLDLTPSVKPFSRCLHCNLSLHGIDAQEARERLPSRIGYSYSQFMHCHGCGRRYWQGTHWCSMCVLLKPLLTPAD